ncbi:8-amino-7-oxononanoate synthase [Providencia hangzhouensis]|nr:MULTISPECIES: 8-amino-7-oxononanoate synthase [Providencia]MBJ9970278.1 8-amino-7-oxononanoate synthase [Providencia rettgeri]MCF8961872.1 8-amino-7-oxononanoate synthase [Providencia rettgeri]TNV05492.1 8-amino-7-oxononanoate synthase [Providencia rettgeri]CAB5552200.1 8-amino-7-oxononanoate synthase [Providencia rettgeri]CAC9154131.1 8-amino-7-oxononanoate synthase [Providencia rettgeri]
MTWQSFIQNQIEQRKQASIWRQRQCIDHANGRSLYFSGKEYLNFSSNDYLGLSHHPQVVAAWQRGADEYGVGSGGSGHITGFTKAHDKLEQALAGWLGYPKALLFISGFAANHAVITALMTEKDRILADKLSHASIMEASIHSGAQLRRFQHNNPLSFENLIHKPISGKTLVVTEGVFSMDGDSAPLQQLQEIARNQHAWLMVDDAHGIGVIGEQGRGSCFANGVKPEILVVTFGKAFGLSGAAVLCDEPTAEFFVQSARHLIYSTSMPPAQAVALLSAVEQIQLADQAREDLNQHIAYFRNNADFNGMQLANSMTAIQPLIIGENQASQQLANFLRKKNIWVQAIRPPTVPPGSARLRVTLSAAHQRQDIDQLLEALHDFIAQS